MDTSSEQSLHDRLASLEAQVASLHEQIAQLQQQAQTAVDTPPPLPPAVKKAPPADEKRDRRKRTRAGTRPPRPAGARVQSALKSEDWLSRLGIGLLLVGLAFLFKLGIDKGWVTPVVRVLFGAVLGAFLLGAGLRLYPKRVTLGRALLGGSIAVFYVTFFAAYQFYSLIGYPLTFGGMSVVTLLCYVLAVRQKDSVLAVIATIGGLGTPFVLETAEGSIPGLMLYSCIILLGAISIYMYRGWRTLLVTAAIGGWLVMLVPWFSWIFSTRGTTVETLAAQGGILFCLVAFGVMPTLREVWRKRDPEQWAVPPLRAYKKDDIINRPALALAFVAPLITLGLSIDMWEWPDVVWGLVIVIAAALYAAAYLALRRLEQPGLASAHGMASAVLLAVAWFVLFDEPWMWLLAFAVETAVLHVLARKLPERAFAFLGHLGFIILIFWLGGRLLDMEGKVPVLVNGTALVDIVVVGLMVGMTWMQKQTKFVTVYALITYIGLLGWFWRDLVALPEGQAYVSIAWGLSALTLLALGWRSDNDWIRNTGLATLLIVIGKLFLVDLERVEAVWRILLFLGFGGLLLLLSYFFPKLWKPTPDEDEKKESV